MVIYMTKHSVSKLTHDYLKLYNIMMEKWRSFLGVRTPLQDAPLGVSSLPFHYISKKLYFDNSQIYSYSFTVSPRSSIAIKDLSLKQQYDFMLNSLKAILSKYIINYYITFELYEDNHDMHCHGILTFSKLTDIANIKRDIRTVYRMPKLKQGEKNALVHIKPLGYDEDQQKRWIGYLYKDLDFMCKNDFTPMYKIIEGYKVSDTIIKPKMHERIILLPTEEQIEEAREHLKNKQDEKDRAEFLLYEKLKLKFEKKPLEKLFSK